MSEQKSFECGPLKATISPRQCLFNVARAGTLKQYHHALGSLWACLQCQQWRRITVSLPEGEGKDETYE